MTTEAQLTGEYREIVTQAKGLMSGETDLIANMANLSALLFLHLKDINWAGFYLYKDDQLVLGPFQGKPACIRIPMGRGVCGTAAQTREVQVIQDVHQFAGHIACDAASNSEIVVPIEIDGKLIGVLDIDSPEFARFNENDKAGLVTLVHALQDTLA